MQAKPPAGVSRRTRCSSCHCGPTTGRRERFVPETSEKRVATRDIVSTQRDATIWRVSRARVPPWFVHRFDPLFRLLAGVIHKKIDQCGHIRACFAVPPGDCERRLSALEQQFSFWRNKANGRRRRHSHENENPLCHRHLSRPGAGMTIMKQRLNGQNENC